jgi:beta-glucosidase
MTAHDKKAQPLVESRTGALLEVDGLRFRDLNKNGTLEPYEDWRRPVDERVADLIGRMTLEEKAGLMVHANIRRFCGKNGEVLDEQPPGLPAPKPNIPNIRPIEPLEELGPRYLVKERHVRWMIARHNMFEAPPTTATYSNAVQEIAEGSRLGIPVVFSSDPRHHSVNLPFLPPEPKPLNISRWPGPLGLAAMQNPEHVEAFAVAAATELRALGIRAMLSPTADLATEPRWSRIDTTFGEDPTLVSLSVCAMIRGLQGRELGPKSVLAVTKHFPGNGPMKDGWDSHNHYGKWQVYPGGKLELHLAPFIAAIEAGTAAIMTGYGIAEGIDTVAMAYSRKIVTELLRERLGFDRMVLSDWLHYMPWGVEHLTREEIEQRMLGAGIDQFGGHNAPGTMVELVRRGLVPEERLDASAARILRLMFQIGIFENPYVAAENAAREVAAPEIVSAGQSAQSASIVLLKNDDLLPLSGRPKLFLRGLDREDAARYGEVVERIEDADVAIVSVVAPYVTRKDGTAFFGFTREGPLVFAGAENEADLHAIREATASGKPTVVWFNLDRPAILSEVIGDVRAMVAHFGSNTVACLDVLFGKVRPTAKLPFDLPRDMASVEKQRPDVPFDLDSPLFPFGFGLTYPEP